ncbi:MAG: acetyl-CoA carboxylase biotin carboxyl carrier protein [Bdellovibrionales bacterium]
MPSSSKFDLDAALVRKLAKLLEETGLGEIEYADGNKKIRCAMPIQHVGVAPAAAPAAALPHVAVAAPAPAAPVGTPVPSPMVGTAYLSPSPGAASFVKAGDKVKQGDTLLIIEAMKVMNPIKSPCAGTIGEILVRNEQPVEFGETLMVIV